MGRVVRLCLLRPGSLSRTDQKQMARSRSRDRHDQGAMLACSRRARRISVVSGGGGGVEIRKAPNDTAALSFVANSEAARYVFVVVAAADVMIAGRRYGTFVLACQGKAQPGTRKKQERSSRRDWKATWLTWVSFSFGVTFFSPIASIDLESLPPCLSVCWCWATG